jgi:hypothetical protein
MAADAADPELAAVGHRGRGVLGLFGVGGGIVIVPLLMLWLGYAEREATGHVAGGDRRDRGGDGAGPGGYGNVDVRRGLLIGCPRSRRRRGHLAAAAGARPLDLARLRGAADGRRRGPAPAVTDVLAIVAIGFAAGAVAGMLGVGGGALFVPALVVFQDSASSRRRRRRCWPSSPSRSSAPGARRTTATCASRRAWWSARSPRAAGVAGVVLANALPERALEIAFGILLLGIAAQLARRALTGA